VPDAAYEADPESNHQVQASGRSPRPRMRAGGGAILRRLVLEEHGVCSGVVLGIRRGHGLQVRLYARPVSQLREAKAVATRDKTESPDPGGNSASHPAPTVMPHTGGSAIFAAIGCTSRMADQDARNGIGGGRETK